MTGIAELNLPIRDVDEHIRQLIDNLRAQNRALLTEQERLSACLRERDSELAALRPRIAQEHGHRVRLEAELQTARDNLSATVRRADESRARATVAELDRDRWRARATTAEGDAEAFRRAWDSAVRRAAGAVEVLASLWADEQRVAPAEYLRLGGEDATAVGECESGWVRAARTLISNAAAGAGEAQESTLQTDPLPQSGIAAHAADMPTDEEIPFLTGVQRVPVERFVYEDLQ